MLELPSKEVRGANDRKPLIGMAMTAIFLFPPLMQVPVINPDGSYKDAR